MNDPILFVPFYPGKWLAGTCLLSAEETGVYITLLARMYETAGPIERDDARLARLCGTKTRPAFSRILDMLIEEGKITLENGALFNEKAKEEIAPAVARVEKCRREQKQ